MDSQACLIGNTAIAEHSAKKQMANKFIIKIKKYLEHI